MNLLMRARAFGPDTSGVAAVEFALLAPVLTFAFLSMVDLGLAANEKMRMDSALRAGAQAAFIDPGADHVREVVAAVAANDFTVSSEEGDFVTSTELRV